MHWFFVSMLHGGGYFTTLMIAIKLGILGIYYIPKLANGL
jgi:hypothetical protein